MNRRMQALASRYKKRTNRFLQHYILANVLKCQKDQELQKQ